MHELTDSEVGAPYMETMCPSQEIHPSRVDTAGWLRLCHLHLWWERHPSVMRSSMDCNLDKLSSRLLRASKGFAGSLSHEGVS